MGGLAESEYLALGAFVRGHGSLERVWLHRAGVRCLSTWLRRGERIVRPLNE